MNSAASRFPSLLRWLKQLTRFASAGLVGTLVQYATLIVLVNSIAMAPGLASGIGAAGGAVVNYLLARSFVFRSAQPHRVALPRFALMAASGVVMNGVLVQGLASLGLHYLLAQVCATGLVLLFNFGVSSSWIFKTPRN